MLTQGSRAAPGLSIPVMNRQRVLTSYERGFLGLGIDESLKSGCRSQEKGSVFVPPWAGETGTHLRIFECQNCYEIAFIIRRVALYRTGLNSSLTPIIQEIPYANKKIGGPEHPH